MKKRNFYYGLACVILGAGLIVLGFVLNTRFSSMICGGGGGILGGGIAQLYRWRKWTRPETADTYREKLEQEQIDLRDERKTMLRDKSGRYAYLFSMALCLAVIFVLCVLSVLEVTDFAFPAVLLLTVYVIIQYLAGLVFYRRLSEKY